MGRLLYITIKFSIIWENLIFQEKFSVNNQDMMWEIVTNTEGPRLKMGNYQAVELPCGENVGEFNYRFWGTEHFFGPDS